MPIYIRLTDYKSSDGKPRVKIIEPVCIDTMVHLEVRAFEEISNKVVQEKDGIR